jgi:hypothetical protein
MNILNSYSTYRGTEHTIREKGSPVGVIIAASINMMHIACFLYSRRFSLVTIPSADNTTIIVGNSNTIPKASTVDENRDIYEDKENVFGTASLT